MPKGLHKKGIIRRNKMLHAAINQFLEKGYERTTAAAIASEAGMATSSFFAAFNSKEELLLVLVKIMFKGQFDSAEAILGLSEDTALLYSVETALQFYITDLSEPLRELYVMAYTLQTTSEYIRSSTALRLHPLFSSYMPEAQQKDFLELDIASGGIMRSFMACKTDAYFTLERKIIRFLECSLTLYCVPVEKQREIIEKVLKMDLKSMAQKIIDSMLKTASASIDRL